MIFFSLMTDYRSKIRQLSFLTHMESSHLPISDQVPGSSHLSGRVFAIRKLALF